jgi:signal transduction histidine kinase
VRRLTRPVADLADAATRLGRDVNAPALPESGPAEIATAAAAFNTMAANIRRFVADRTQMLAAISHDLRTPITRLRLRAEFLEDDEQRAKMLADLAEMEAMIASTLAFARDDAANEPAISVDLASLAPHRAGRGRRRLPGACGRGHHLSTARTASVIRVRPMALKRALANLVGNALNYGGNAWVTVEPPTNGLLMLRVEDSGQGIPEESLEAVFQPFRGWRPAATARPAAPAWACPSPAASCAPMAATWCCGTGRKAG